MTIIITARINPKTLNIVHTQTFEYPDSFVSEKTYVIFVYPSGDGCVYEREWKIHDTNGLRGFADDIFERVRGFLEAGDAEIQ